MSAKSTTLLESEHAANQWFRKNYCTMLRLASTSLLLCLVTVLSAQVRTVLPLSVYKAQCVRTVASSNNPDCENDTEGPVILNFEEKRTVDCNWALNLDDYIVSDACESITVDAVVNSTSEASIVPKNTVSPYYTTPKFSMWFTAGFPQEEEWFELIDARLEQTESTLTVEGDICLPSAPDDGFHFQLDYDSRMDWTGWNTQPGYHVYKADWPIVEEEYLDWEYMLVVPTSYMTGFGKYEGTHFELTHSPSNEVYAAQLGIGANNANIHYGLGGWFYWDGPLMIDGQAYSTNGAGDFFFDMIECVVPTHTVDLTLTDACGNTSYYSQTLYASSAAITSGVCPCIGGGCQNPEASNYNPDAPLNDWSCVGCFGDVNLDGSVDTGDMLAIMGEYGCALPENCPSDLDGDGVVSVSDFIDVLSGYGTWCNYPF